MVNWILNKENNVEEEEQLLVVQIGEEQLLVVPIGESDTESSKQSAGEERLSYVDLEEDKEDKVDIV